MASQSVLGLLFHDEYRDAEWIAATWFGNDLVTLTAGVPMLAIAFVSARRGSTRGGLLWLGALAYAAYNYAFYAFGAALNVFFPFYIVAVVLAVVTLTLAVAHLDVAQVASAFRSRTPVRLIGGYLALVGVGLATVWLATWAAYVFEGRATPVEPDAFRLVAILDLSIMVPLLVCGGLLLWRRDAWGYVIAAIASIQSSLYLSVLCVNSYIAIRRGLAAWPGELPTWSALALASIVATTLLLGSVTRQAANQSWSRR